MIGHPLLNRSLLAGSAHMHTLLSHVIFSTINFLTDIIMLSYDSLGLGMYAHQTIDELACYTKESHGEMSGKNIESILNVFNLTLKAGKLKKK
ncbi:hypothetical protein [Poriferisphaera sp. WC338]|uniref:hypothetical protein n=1 Tax=Poriferisphaera sp. WC338 TaxID=3425129 RepID=UPI003D81B0A6